MRVLVVENDQATCDLFGLVISDMGHAPTTFENAEDALANVSLLSPDLAVIDLGLPNMCGEELVGSLRVLYPKLPIVLVSVSPDVGAVALRLRAEGYVSKPFVIEEFIACLSEVLRPA